MNAFLKCLLLAVMVSSLGLTTLRAALVSESYSFSSVNLAVPDGNAAGASDVRSISSEITSINSVSVTIGISSTFNGDMFLYLRHGTGLSILLNRTGRTAGNAYGYDDSGFSITFQDSAMNGDVHTYRNLLTPADGSPLTGAWQPDARAVDPAAVTDASSRTAYLSSFNGLNANGTWTLFAADLQSGEMSTINNWSLQLDGVSAVPEPVNVAMAIFGAMFCLIAVVRHRMCQRKARL